MHHLLTATLRKVFI